MKNSLKILFSAWYLFLSVGFSIATHYCGDMVDDVKLVSVINQSPPSDCCGPETNYGCCTTEFDSFKLVDFQQSADKFQFNYFEEDFLLPISLANYSPINVNLHSEETNFHDIASPPDIFLKNCSFLI